jgi:DNA mismatch endonuclease (patch repair protein)
VTDTLTPQQRSQCMRAVRGKDTTPELTVRRLAHCMGFRYALHSRNLPGKPDLVFRSRKKIIFVHGCFWHKHSCRHGRISPVSNSDYWCAKREKNSIRDRRHVLQLREKGWDVLIVWECWTKDLPSLRKRLEAFFSISTG